MASLISLANQPIYAIGENLDGSDFIRNLDTELWVKRLNYGSKVPDVVTVSINAGVSADDTSISLIITSGATSGVLQKNDVLYFPTDDVLAVISATTAINDTAAVPVPVFPLEGAITLNETADTYLMTPLLSLQDGGSFEGSGASAEAFNKSQGIWRARAIIERDATISIAGTYYRFDRGAALLRDAFLTKANNIYVQIRNRPYVVDTNGQGVSLTRGQGNAAISVQAVLHNFSLDTSSRGEFTSVTGELVLSGQPAFYTPLGLALP